MKECRRKSWYVFGSVSDEKETKLVRYNIKPVGVYIRRYVVLLAWYGALSVRWERYLEKMWAGIIDEMIVYMGNYGEEDY